VLVAVALLVTIVLPLPPAREADARLMTDMLQMASLVLALGVSAMGLARWRLTGDAAALWIAAALLVFGIVRLGVVELLPVVVAGDVVLVLAGWLRPASLLVTAGLLTAAAMAPLVDSGLKPLRVCGIAAVAIALVAAIMGFMPGISSFVDGVGGQGARPYVSTSGIGVMPEAVAVHRLRPAAACPNPWRGDQSGRAGFGRWRTAGTRADPADRTDHRIVRCHSGSAAHLRRRLSIAVPL
jgi:hypothetical protein